MERLSEFNEKERKGFFSRIHSYTDVEKGSGILWRFADASTRRQAIRSVDQEIDEKIHFPFVI